jgi:hypothetical protein
MSKKIKMSFYPKRGDIESFVLAIWPPLDREERAIYNRAVAEVFECDISLVRNVIRDIVFLAGRGEEDKYFGAEYYVNCHNRGVNDICAKYEYFINMLRYPDRIRYDTVKDDLKTFDKPVITAIIGYYATMRKWKGLDPGTAILANVERIQPNINTYRVDTLYEGLTNAPGVKEEIMGLDDTTIDRFCVEYMVIREWVTAIQDRLKTVN